MFEKDPGARVARAMLENNAGSSEFPAKRGPRPQDKTLDDFSHLQLHNKVKDTPRNLCCCQPLEILVFI